MRVSVVRGDITEQDVDAVVNAANKVMRDGGGVDGAIHAAGGPEGRRLRAPPPRWPAHRPRDADQRRGGPVRLAQRGATAAHARVTSPRGHRAGSAATAQSAATARTVATQR